jgi:stage II sporulation protein GA (sporulation sigma-E factor processing peptidase)
MPVVYIDVVWLINLMLDGFILLVTVFLARRSIYWWRTIGASAIGASYALFLFFPVMSIFLTFFFKFLFSVIMVWIAFKPKGLFDFGKMLGLFYLASFLAGGAAYAANNFFNNVSLQNGLVLLNGGTVWLQKTTLALVVLAMPIVYLLGKSAWKRLARSKQREQNFWDVRVQVGTHSMSFTGLMDTGNALNDPLSRLPVMVADWVLFQEALPAAVASVLEKGMDISFALGDIEMDDEWQSRFRLVPYRGVGGSMGMLLAFRPECVELSGQEGDMHTCRRVLIGLNPKPLAGDGSYRAILHPSMIQSEADPEPGSAAS